MSLTKKNFSRALKVVNASRQNAQLLIEMYLM